MNPGIDAPQPEDRVFHDRQEGVQHQGRKRGGLADLATKGDQQESQQCQAGDGLKHARHADRRPLDVSAPRGQNAQRHPHEHRKDHRLHDQLEVRRGGSQKGPAFGDYRA